MTPKPTAPVSVSRRPGRPRGSKNRRAAWFDPSAARAHLLQIDRELERLRSERALILHVLGQSGAPLSARSAPLAAFGGSAATGGKRPGRRPRSGGPSMLDLIERVMAAGAAGKGWTVGELRDQIMKIAPDRANMSNASALLSSALVQAMRAKKPRFQGSKGGRGHPRKYRLAAA